MAPTFKEYDSIVYRNAMASEARMPSWKSSESQAEPPLLLTQNNEEVKVVQGSYVMPTVASRWIFALRRNAEQATGTKQTCSDGTQRGRSTGLTGPNWTMTQIANSLQVLDLKWRGRRDSNPRPLP